MKREKKNKVVCNFPNIFNPEKCGWCIWHSCHLHIPWSMTRSLEEERDRQRPSVKHTGMLRLSGSGRVGSNIVSFHYSILIFQSFLWKDHIGKSIYFNSRIHWEGRESNAKARTTHKGPLRHFLLNSCSNIQVILIWERDVCSTVSLVKPQPSWQEWGESEHL